jgi:hypothetical protein
MCLPASRWWETRRKRLLLRDAGKQRAFQQRAEAEGGQDRSLAILVSGIRPSTSPPRPAGIARLCAALLPAFAIGVTHRHCAESALIKCKSELHNPYNVLFCSVLSDSRRSRFFDFAVSLISKLVNFRSLISKLKRSHLR